MPLGTRLIHVNTCRMAISDTASAGDVAVFEGAHLKFLLTICVNHACY